MHLADALSKATVYSGYTFVMSMCVPWKLNPQPFALLMQCSTTETQQHMVKATADCTDTQLWY